VQYLAQCDWIADVPRTAFEPPPKVDSAIVRLSPYQIGNPASNPRFLDQLVKLGFATRRKMLRNNLKSLLDSDRVPPILEQLGIESQVRAEELSLRQWIDLSNLLETLI
jgi:16S rRNA (adenine1518-N6/adenine1519-N6)-dimethyltransferase